MILTILTCQIKGVLFFPLLTPNRSLDSEQISFDCRADCVLLTDIVPLSACWTLSEVVIVRMCVTLLLNRRVTFHKTSGRLVETDGSLFINRQVVLLKTTGHFRKTTGCFVGNDGSLFHNQRVILNQGLEVEKNFALSQKPEGKY